MWQIGDSKGLSGLFLILLDEAKKGFLRIYNIQVSPAAGCPGGPECKLH